jgi:folate-dependent phosphoribosylglycinamide formyltransferase PurN
MLKPHHPLRVAVLCSHRAPGLLYLLNRSPDRGVTYEIACVVSSDLAFAEEVRVERRGIPTRGHSIHDFYESRAHVTVDDLDVRAEYDAETLKLIEAYTPDVVLLDGYLYLLTRPMLAKFPSRIISLHFSDLTLRNVDGSPRFPGIHAVRDAMLAGCGETRATVHLVNERLDDGPPLVRSWPFSVSPLVEDLRTQDAPEVMKAYMYAHEQWMRRTVSGPLVAAALRLISTGGVDLDELAAHGVSSPWMLDRLGWLHAPEQEPVFA